MNVTQTYALRYAGLDWSVIPINDREKTPSVPSWRAYQKTRPSREQLLRWTWHNLAIVTGAVSGICVIDEDDLSDLSDADRSKAEAFINSLPPTATAKTGKGRHFYFALPQGDDGKPILVPSKVRFMPGIDCRAEGGYALAPPSVHPNGTIYTWEEDCGPEDGLAELPVPIVNLIRGASAVAETQFSKNGVPMWRAGLDGVAEGKGRNSTAASMTGKLLSSMPREMWPMAFEALKAWNAKNTPPLSDKELRTTFESIRNKEIARVGETKEIEIQTLESLIASNVPATPQIVEDILAAGTTMLIGKPKLGKSRLALQLALCVATGARPFNRLLSTAHGVSGKVMQGNILYLALEDSKARYRERVMSMLGSTPAPSGETFRLTTTFPHLFDGGLDRLAKEIERDKDLRLIVVDTLAAFAGGAGANTKGNAFSAEYRMIRPLFDLVNGSETSLVLVHHARKDQPGTSDPFDSVAGTLGGQAAVDSILVMHHPRKKPITLVGRGRDIESFELPLADDGLRWKVAESGEGED